MDDGIELNFATGDSVVARKPAIQKGGRWTDRAKQRKDARQSYKQIAKRPAPTQSSIPTTAAPVRASPAAVPAPPAPQVEAPTPRPSQAPAVARPVPAKSTTSTGSTQSERPRQSSPRQQRPSYDQQPAAGPSRIPAGPPQPKGQIISSLFSSNPVPSVRPVSTKSTIGAPSNAPLTGDTNTFPGLGLDPLLVHHLTNKMGVKAPTSIQRSSLPFMLSEPLDLSTPTYDEDGEEETKPIIQKALRDVFIQSQTGSGKTLTYLLPIIQTLLPLSKLSHIDRSIGTLAIILAPTRELAQQIEKVLDQVLSMALSLPDSDITDERYTRWLVSGLLVGGSTRTHEKAKLRKGVPILVATPGRLLDHLQNTASFQCAKTMFLVLDEADRVMDLGFEETIQGIIKALDGRRRLEIAAEKEMDEVGGGTMRWPFWGRGRRTILCSATVDSKVQKLAGVALQDPILFKGTDDKPKDVDSKVKEATSYDPTAIELPQTNLEKFTPPSQLSQKYVVVPTKLRLVALVALIRSFVASATEGGNKIIVFLSSTDAVDFHWKMLGGIRMDRDDNITASKDASAVTLQSPLFPNTNLQRLHGSLPLQTRRSSLAAFAAASESPSVLFATSVASRGLDLPLVRAVIQYDLPTEGGANEYVHRVGRTARAGKGGEAWAMVAPNETGWVKWVEGKMGAVGEKEVKLGQAGVEEVLKKGFGGKGYEYEARATQAQLAFERWVTDDEQNAAMSRKAFASFVRAYSTHPLEEKVFFHPKSLHLGHLAKAFALREAPSVMAGMTKASAKTAATAASTKQPAKKRKREDGEESASSDGSDDDEPAAKGGKESTARNETERRMYEAVRKAGRAVKSGGALGEFDKKVRGVNGRKPTAMASSGGGEFQVMGGDEIERMVSGKRR